MVLTDLMEDRSYKPTNHSGIVKPDAITLVDTRYVVGGVKGGGDRCVWV